ncbi:hypothetical protein [Streptomyces sp. NPDC086519]
MSDRPLTDQQLDDDNVTGPESDEGEDNAPNPPYDLPDDDFLGCWA